MRIESEVYNYIEKLSDRIVDIQYTLISLGKIGILFHPFRIIKLKREFEKLEKIDTDVSNMSNQLRTLKAKSEERKNIASSSGQSFVDAQEEQIEQNLREYMFKNEITPYGLRKRRRKKYL